MTSKPLYMKPHPVCRATYTLYMWHHSHYLCPQPTVYTTSNPLYVWHHTPQLCIIVCTTQDNTSSLYDFKPPCLCQHTNYIWHFAHCICVITSTVLIISHKLYFWDHICYNSQHHLPCIWHDSNCMPLQSLHSWHQIPYIWHHLQGLWHLVPIHVTSQPLCLWIHVNYI